MKTLKQLTAISLLLSAGLIAKADSLSWDQTGGGALGGAGTWNLNSTANWWNGTADVTWKDNSALGTNSAIFATGGAAVTLNTSLSASNLQFTASGYTISGSGTLTLGAGGIDASALGSGTTTIGNALSLSGGQQSWLAGSGSTLAVNGTVTRAAGATVDFSTTGVTSTMPNVNGILGGWATTGSSVSSASTGDWAATNGSGAVVTYTGYTSVTGAQAGAGASAQNWKNTGTTTLSASATINSIVAAFDIGPNAGVTTTIGSGGLILQGISRWIINNGGGNYSTGTLIPGTASGELFIHAPNGDMIVNTAAGNNWRIWPRIQNNGSTPTILVKDGPGLVSLMATNSYTGGTIINNGILVVNKQGSTTAAVLARNWSSLGFGTVTVNGPGIFEVGYGNGNGTDFQVTNSFVINGGKYLANDGTHRQTGPVSIGVRGATFGSTYDGGTKGLFIDGLVSGSGPITLQQAYQAGEASYYNNPDGSFFNSSVVYFTSAANTYSGTVSVIPYSAGAGSYLAINASSTLQFAALNLANNAGSWQRYSNTAGVFTPLIFNTGLGSATFGSIAGSGNIILNGYNESTYALQTDAIALTVGGNNASTTESGIITGSGSLTKTGTGTLTLSGANIYTGNTTVNGGSLVLGGGSLANSTNIIVGSGATFDVSAIAPLTLSASQNLLGSGTNIGSIATGSGSKIYAGLDGTYGTNRFNNNLTLTAGTLAYFDVGTLANGSNDLIAVAGTVTANNNVIHLKAPSGSTLQTTDYVLIRAGSISGSCNGTPVWDVSPVNAANFSIVTSGTTVTLHYSANSAPTGVAFATPATAVRNQNVLLTVLATNGLPGTVSTAVVDASSVGGSAALSLVRSNLSNVFTNTVTVAPATAPGSKTLLATVTDTTPLNAVFNIALNVVVTNDVWNGLGANNNFSSNLNWLIATAPGYVGDSLTFAGGTRLTPNMDNNYTVTGVTFDNTAGSFNISSAGGNALTLTGSGVTNNSANAETLNVPVTMSVPQTFNAAAGNLNLSQGIASGANLITVTGPANTAVSGAAITGSGSLFKQGSGTLTVSSNSLFDLFQASSGGFSGPLIAQSGALTFNNGGSNQVNGELVIGGVIANGGAGNNAKIIVDNAKLNVGSWLSIGRGNGVGAVSSDLVLSNGAAVTTVNLSAGYNGGNAANLPKGSVTLNGSSSLAVANTGEAFHIGESSGSDMAFTVNDTATLSGAGLINVGMNNGKGAITVNGGSVSCGGIMRIGRGASSTSSAQGTVTVNTGSLFSENDIVLGYAGSGAAGNLGRLVINGGTVNLASTLLRWLIVGQFDTSPGQLEVNGGQLNLNANSSIRASIGNASTTSTNSITLNNGAITFYSDNATTVGGSGQLDLQLSGNAGSVCTVNLNGGTITVPSVVSSATSGTRVLNLNGGTIKAAAAGSLVTATAASVANVRNGGAKVDDNGNTVSVDQTLVHSTVAGDNATDGGLTKSGAGTVQLTAADTYTGNTLINAGTLALTGSGFIANSANIFTAAGSTFDVSAISFSVASGQGLGGSGSVNGSPTANAGAKILGGTDGTYGTNTFLNDLTLSTGSAVYLDLGTNAVGTNDLVVVSGTLNANNNVIHIKAPSVSSKLATNVDYVLVSAGTITGTFASAPVWDVAPLNSGNFTIVTSGTTVTLHFTPTTLPSGSGSANPATVSRNQSTKVTVATGVGSFPVSTVVLDGSQIGLGSSISLVRSNTSSLWTNTVAATPDTAPGVKSLPATITDTAANTGLANVALTVVVTNDVWNGAGADDNFSSNLDWVNNAAPGYLGDSLTFAGTTRLTPNMDNNYTVTSVTFNSGAGSFNIGTGSSTLSNSGDIVNNSANAQTLNVPIVLTAAQSFNTASGDMTVSGTVSDTGFGITKSGVKKLTLSGNNTYTGQTTVSAGTLNLSGTIASTANVVVGSSAGNSILNVSGSGSASPKFLNVGNVTNAVGAVYQSGGTINLTQLTTYDDLSLGNVQGSYGYFLQDGGTLTVNGICVGGEANDGTVAHFNQAGGNGILEVKSGLVDCTGWLVLARQNAGTIRPSFGGLNVFGGQLNYAGNGIVGPWASGESATINVMGGVVSNSAAVGVLLGNTGFEGILNLKGGVLQAFVVQGYNGPTFTPVTSGLLNFNGGTLQASADNAGWVSVDQIHVFSGGATLNNNGFSVAVSGPLLAPTGNGVTGITSLAGGSGYIAPPIIVITNATGDTTGFGATAIAQINPVSGAVTGVTITCPGWDYTAAPVLVFSGGGATAQASATALIGANSSGGLTSTGSGTNYLAGANTYTGNTTVSGGVLELAQATLPASGTVSIASGAKLQLDFSSTTTNIIGALVLNGATQPAGIVYSAANASPFITGTGKLLVPSPIASYSTNITASVSGSTMTITWPVTHLGWILQAQTNTLGTGLGNNWFDVAGSAGVTSSSVTINPSAPTVFYRLRHP